jgi:hypothetical protein
VAQHLVASRVVFSPIELVSWYWKNYETLLS